MTFELDTRNDVPLNNKLGKLSNIYCDCSVWESYSDYKSTVDALTKKCYELANKISTVDDLTKLIDKQKFYIETEDGFSTELKGTVDKLMFDVDGIWVDCFFDDGNEYFASFLFAWTNEPVIAYRG